MLGINYTQAGLQELDGHRVGDYTVEVLGTISYYIDLDVALNHRNAPLGAKLYRHATRLATVEAWD